ncbi:tRNA (adenosine(37)-N6)-threonylcarbamoyltransferase complex transferase subunit TsaD [Neorickettsia findlayensis]|uniref:tRNA N6-adenosine threonylcarbamoyltransferase n=1 Tax=Neorickettsia findlayensis TaxID=2686014 RepID=A0A6P1G9X5_9RICK|nr:tRNA (adenosine(37)-N6)-threonylcarbamoyltransferase complex transferase subunit TsaD [Neorickettsia findlayensis]QHD65023.1 tRNA (adenosine(37)-N6)-threonylcarbamoyltransferase complex transferase subunit TsaD [Neorickettsia findlayensis]
MNNHLILGIETSCDETSVAIVSEERKVYFHEIFTQDHSKYNGVYPEFASREHLKILPQILRRAAQAHDLEKLTSIACTVGPGLVGSLIVGVMMARGLAFLLKKPVLGINHLEGHLLAARLTKKINFPFVCLVISGGHSQLINAKKVGDYLLLGETLDDAFGEAFDKLATMLGFTYPGGKIVEKFASKGDSERFRLPAAMINQPGCNFSLSGIKTALKKIITSLPQITEQDKADICASFQACVARIMVSKLEQAVKICGHSRIVLAGGVASNRYVRKILEEFAKNHDLSLHFPEGVLCTDNAAMIAWAAIERITAGCTELPLEPQPRLCW